MSRMFEHGPMNFRLMSPVIKGLIVANAVVFVLSALVGAEFSRIFGLTPYYFTHKLFIWQPFTYLFLHGGLFHLLINLFVLWMFGMAIESQWGPRGFLQYYLICGVGAGLFNVVLTPNSMAPIVGASGAIYGLLVAFAMLYPDAVVYLYFLFPVKAKHMAILIAGITFFSAIGSGGGSVVAHFAHLGGMLIGYVYIRWWWEITLRLKALIGAPGAKAPRGGKSARKIIAPDAGDSPGDEMAEVDRILDKILDSGEESLTERELDILRRHSRKGRGGRA